MLVTTTADASIVTVVGDVDLVVVPRLGEVLRVELELRPRVLIADVSAVTFCAARLVTLLGGTATDADTCRKHREEVAELRRALEVAHGELLILRRRAQASTKN